MNVIIIHIQANLYTSSTRGNHIKKVFNHTMGSKNKTLLEF